MGSFLIDNRKGTNEYNLKTKTSEYNKKEADSKIQETNCDDHWGQGRQRGGIEK